MSGDFLWFRGRLANQLAAEVTTKRACGSAIDGTFGVMTDCLSGTGAKSGTPQGVIYFIRLVSVAAVFVTDDVLADASISVGVACLLLFCRKELETVSVGFSFRKRKDE